jgi:hypothetical protein
LTSLVYTLTQKCQIFSLWNHLEEILI